MCLSLVIQLCPTLWDPIDCSHARLLCPWGFSRQEYWSGLPRPPPGDLPDPGMEPTSLMSPVLAGRFFTTGITRRRGLHINKATVIHTTKHSHAYDFNIWEECHCFQGNFSSPNFGFMKTSEPNWPYILIHEIWWLIIIAFQWSKSDLDPSPTAGKTQAQRAEMCLQPVLRRGLSSSVTSQ